MSAKKQSIHFKAWIEDEDGNTVLGHGSILILETIKRTGSINSAAKELKMGYRSMWGKIKKIEQRLGYALLIKTKGGARGGSSVLTPRAEKAVLNFKNFQNRMEIEANRLFREFFSA